jgi:VanZ family protein
MPPLGVSDTKLHFTGFAVLTVLFWSALASRGYGRAWRAVLVLGIVSLYGGFDELTQPLVNRTAAWGDWYGDVAGTAAAWLCLEVIAAIRVMHHRASRERKRAGLLPSDLPSVVHRTKDGRG